ncbi:MAG: hypothetical protein ACFFC7_01480 [Candidatus Hermodarchaeota archaeon]
MASSDEISRLENLLEKALNVSQCKVVRVWKGFLLACKIPNQKNTEEPFVIWIHEQNMQGVLSKSGAIDKSIDLISIGAWFINPIAGLLAGTGRLLIKLGSPPRENQIYSARTHFIEYGTYFLTKHGTILKTWDILKKSGFQLIDLPKRLINTLSSIFSDLIPTDNKDLETEGEEKDKTEKQTVSSTRVLIPPGDGISYTFIRFNSRLNVVRLQELETNSTDSLSKVKGMLETVSSPNPPSYKVFDQEEAFNFLSRLKRYGFEIHYVPEK